MSIVFQQSEATAAQRHFPVYLVDAGDGLTPETGEAAGQPQVSKNGGSWANTSATLTAVGNGYYYVILTATELNTLGLVAVRYKSANTAEFNLTGQVVAYDPYAAYAVAGDAMDLVANAVDATSVATGAIDADAIAADAIGSSELATTAVDEIVDAVWDELATGHTDAGKAGQQLWTDVDAILDDTGTTLDGKLNTAQADLDTITGAAGVIIDDSAANDTTLSDAVWDEAIAGHVGVGSFGEEVQAHAQTGDAMDLVANAVDATSVATGAIDADAIAADAITNAKIANDAIGATEIADGAIDAATFAAGAINAAAIATDAIDADALAANAVDEFWDEAMTETTGAPAVTASFREAIKWMFALARNKITQNATTTTLRNDADDADLATSTVSDDATTYTRGEWSV